MLQAARTRPSELGLPYSSWTFDRLAAQVKEQLGLSMKKTRIFEILQEEGLRWRKQETWFGERPDPEFVQQRGPRSLRTAPPANSGTLDIDEMGPVAAKSYPGKPAMEVNARPAQRATQQIDYGRRAKGYVYGALWKRRASAGCSAIPWRIKEHFIDFLCFVDEHLLQEVERIYAIMDKLDMHHCHDLLLFLIHHPCWEFVSQPKYAAYLNVSERWWKVLRSLALKGRRFETWQQVEQAVEAAIGYLAAPRSSLPKSK